MSLKIKQIDWKRDKESLLSIERSSFGSIASDENDLSKQIDKGFGFIVFDGLQNALGYIIAIPLEKAPYKGCTEDMSRNRSYTAYVESLAIKQGATPATLLRLVIKLGNELESRRYRRMTMHVESDSKMYRVLTNLGARELCNFNNWMGWGKTFNYLEMPLDE